MRADAQRNRDKIVDAAREAFRCGGYDVPLDQIAKAAGVGPGTLYRHFPTRDDLLDAVMAPWVANVEAAADRALAATGTPRERLLAWFDEYVHLICVHKGGPAKFTTALGDEGSPIKHKCGVLLGAHERVLEPLLAEGALRDGVTAIEVGRLVGGVAMVSDSGGLDEAAVAPMLAVVADGLLAPAPAASAS
ncbi:TetR/AcrR family transcriptional regulator [Nocardioides sp. GY 10127]|uniref:TetR/AcrR family transcriptional regulator n=1 Tax=Nocardioides sp. GY 10127 TaxID=2569762 RepID=UPI0010A7FAC7|nr:TetR/AcrR family transcriptional regulator [Nocardioides sp. GY 10127]TIC80190.1 TetR/AcrR family transcriptional regulator [Nocardioides sp. GY 10127]